MNTTGYQVGNAPSAGTASAGTSKPGYWDLAKCKRSYMEYLDNKTEEIEEQKNARRYYHGSQWTEAQIQALNKRKQPVVTFNRIGRKIDGVVGLIERLRQDPKAFPRTPKHEQGADLATAALRYVLDEQDWKAKSPEVARDGAIDGIGGVEIEVTQGDHGDNEVALEVVEPDSFFYDPRSYRADFSDARFMGLAKWVDIDTITGMMPDKAAELEASSENSTEMTTNPDRENKWFSSSGSRKLIRLVDIWYQHKGNWCWAMFTGSMILMEGQSYLQDEKGKGFCKYIMFSGNVDHDGDRYGFVRNMKSAQDEFNSRRSKALHTLNSRRLLLTQGAVDDVEKARQEYAREDGVVVVNSSSLDEAIKADDKTVDFAGQVKMMENAQGELENYGPNQALIGDAQNQSGRAIQLLQQAGMAELGPYIMGYRGWKIRVYRAVWNAVQRSWSGERWIRVTDDEEVTQFIQINGMQTDPRTGLPSMVNNIGSLDVDIILDEGPDTVNAQQDVYETLTQVLPSVAPMLTPPLAQAAVRVLLESSALPGNAKKAFREAQQQSQQPDPMTEQAKQIQLEGEAAKVEETRSKVALNMSKAQEAMQPEMGAPLQPADPPEPYAAEKALAEISKLVAQADKDRAAAEKTRMDTMLAPAQAEHQQNMDAANFQQGIKDRAEDRKIAARAPKKS